MNQTTTETERKIHARQEKLRELLRQKGAKPYDGSHELPADFWTEDDDIDKFLTWVRSSNCDEDKNK